MSLHSKYEEAEVIASRSLELDPRSRKARYSRAIARWKSGNLRGAVADIDTLYALGAQNFPGLKKTRKTLYQILERTGTTLLAGERDLSWPDIYTDPVQPTSDDHRPFKEIAPGQFRPGAPCWHHNIRECDGGNSIRDTNDRNVCLQFLLGNCQRERCYHSHSTSGLPEDVTIAPSRDSKFTLRLQWWNNPSRMVEIRQLLQDRQDRRKARYEAKPKAPGETRPGQTQNVDKPSPTSSTKNVRVKRAKEKPDPAHNQKPNSVVSTKVGCQGPTSQTSKKETKHANHD
ncbi:hypothetical protein BDP27DRAFT_1314882 [Rhodocollybia butyracea]|uniref:C3H1-type domain-containing protein n=1 Tax=Rhodocollybia butyracea TaxID=206335 RepID=A0A9P5Q817_9AGAR|nr:hypothetical protein BDP27DRAFT_1314882 [Rhodocollybia butyracea]